MLSQTIKACHSIKITNYIPELIRMNHWVQKHPNVNKLLTTDINFGETVKISTSHSGCWTFAEEDYSTFFWLANTKNEQDSREFSTQIRDPFFTKIEHIPTPVVIIPSSRSHPHQSCSSIHRAHTKQRGRVSNVISAPTTTIINIYKKDDTMNAMYIAQNIVEHNVYSPQTRQMFL